MRTELKPVMRTIPRGWLVFSVVLILLVLGLGAGYHWLESGEYASASGANLLILGTDKNWSAQEESTRTDTILVMGIKERGKAVSILSVPRDTLMEIPGRGRDRVNSAHSRGGTELTQSVLESFLGVPINHYVKTNFEGFMELVDVVGGIEIDVEKDLFYRDNSQSLIIDLKEGRQRLTGDQALQYTRFRNDKMGDIGRVQRQQKVIKALIRESLAWGNLRKWPQLWRNGLRHIETDLKTTELVRLAWALRQINPEQLNMKLLPGNFYGVYWEADPAETRRIAQECLAPAAMQ